MIVANFLTLLPLLLATEGAFPTSRGNYGTNYDYGGSVLRSAVQWAPYVPVLRSQRSPLNYYTVYPYSQSYPEDYYRSYPQDTYPVYYPRSAKYDLYQAALPSYYQKPVSEINDAYDGYYYDIDPTELQEEILQEVEREERKESQPIGHEMLYENEDYAASNMNKYDKASVAYFQSMLAQKNRDVFNKQQKYQPLDYGDDYEWQDVPATKLPPYHPKEDKEVQDLRKLKYRSAGNKQNAHSSIPSEYYIKNRMNDKRGSIYSEQMKLAEKHKMSTELKNQVKAKNVSDTNPLTGKSSTSPSKTSVLEPRKELRGQKEEVMMRPATPVRHPFNGPLLDMMVNEEERKRSPSVFDTLKHILEMEKALKNKYEDEIRPIMKKRIISDEDSLIRQLTVLKKSK